MSKTKNLDNQQVGLTLTTGVLTKLEEIMKERGINNKSLMIQFIIGEYYNKTFSHLNQHKELPTNNLPTNA